MIIICCDSSFFNDTQIVTPCTIDSPAMPVILRSQIVRLAGEWRGDRLHIKGMLSAVEPASAIKCRANAYYNIKKRPFMRETTSSGIFR